ncbi:MAG: cupin domain-containing protein [Dehalococcoidia bacterium]|nr:cupin domain-containing protein [Dehalococcoidia bacterium]MDW8119032.1 cupin domain-containing protein [Chloroflexota bacterium]
MPILRHADSPVQQPWQGVSSRGVVRKEVGAERLTVNEITLAPGAFIPLHIHPTHEEAIVILEGEVEATLGDSVQRIAGGHTVLAPTGVKHMLKNVGTRPARILAIFPTTDPQRHLL